MKISLIVATINRKNELVKFLNSLLSQTYQNFEVVIVDQNISGYLEPVLQSYYQKINIIHITSEPGLAKARNVGLNIATGEIICFPDDDCWYDNRTLDTAVSLLADKNLGFVSGRLEDGHQNDCLKKWPKYRIEINKYNVWKCVISVTLFIKMEYIRGRVSFDESLGVGSGTPWGSGEETDFTLKLIQICKGMYTPVLLAYHPQHNPDNSTLLLEKLLDKEYSYGCGLGRVVNKNNYNILFKVNIIIRPLLGWVLYWMLNNRNKSKMYWYNLIGRLHGLSSK